MDVFGRQDQILYGGLSSDAMFVSWPEIAAVGGGLGLLIQQIRLDYRQPIRRIFEIGPGVVPVRDPGTGAVSLQPGSLCDNNPPPGTNCAARTQPTYYIVGRPEGSLQMGRIVGPNFITTCFYRKYGSPCGPNVMSLSGKAGCSASDPKARQITWTINGVTLNSLGMDITGQEMVIQEQIGAMFAGLNVTIQGDDANCNPQLQG